RVGYLINQTNATARFKLPNERNQEWVTICDTNVRNLNPGHAEGEVLLSPTSMVILHYQPKPNSPQGEPLQS
ncbi:hypothetical protein HC02_28645, partial [Vibrio parahaemolyticus]